MALFVYIRLIRPFLVQPVFVTEEAEQKGSGGFRGLDGRTHSL